MSAMAELDAIRSGLITQMYLDITDWTRIAEVVDYALARGITIDAAVGELVNNGLSHLPWKESSNAYVPDYSPPPQPCKGAGKEPTSTTVTDGDWTRGMCGVCGSEGHRLTKDGLIPAHAASFRRDRDRV